MVLVDSLYSLLSLKLDCRLLKVIKDFLFFFGSFTACSVLYIINALLIFTDYSMNDRLYEYMRHFYGSSSDTVEENNLLAITLPLLEES